MGAVWELVVGPLIGPIGWPVLGLVVGPACWGQWWSIIGAGVGSASGALDGAEFFSVSFMIFASQRFNFNLKNDIGN